jgi:hypothetical protein
MFRSNPESNEFIPVKEIQVKPEAQVEYNPDTENQPRFLIPQYVGFMNPKDTTLEFDIQMTGRGYPKPDPSGGIHSLIRDIRIQDGMGQTTIEEIMDYNVLTSQWWGWTENQTISQKRSLFEGQDKSANTIKSSLYYANEPVTDYRTGYTEDKPPAKIQVKAPLYTGIFSGKVFPLLATSGLRVSMSLDQKERSLMYTTGGYTMFPPTTPIEDLAPLVAPNTRLITFKCGHLNAGSIGSGTGTAVKPKAAGTTLDELTPIEIITSSNNPGGDPDVPEIQQNPYHIGDRIYILGVVGGVQTSITGIVHSFANNVSGVDSIIKMNVNFDVDIDTDLPFAPDTFAPVIIDPQDRLKPVTTKDFELINSVYVNSRMADVVGYKINDLMFNVSQVNPPEGYVAALQSQINSKGLAMDFKTYSLYKVNLNARNGLTNQLIPANEERSYSCLSVPMDQDSYNKVERNSLSGIVDGAKNYQYVLGGNLIPDRPVNLNRYTLEPPRTEALHLLECEKSLVNCGYAVRNLQNVPTRFLISRGFSRYNQVTNLNDRSLSLRVEYENATKDKVYNNYICHLRRLLVAKGRVEAF